MNTSQFSNEKELQFAVAQLDISLPNRHHTVSYKREVPVGAYIPDLVYVYFKDEPNDHLWPAKLSYRHAHAIWLLRQQPLDRQALAGLFFETTERVAPIVRDLRKSGAVEELESSELVLSEGMAALAAEVVAAEVKLSRWREALQQAKMYLDFADRAFVAMDAAQVPHGVDVMSQFEDSGIGLCAIHKDRIEWILFPMSQPRHSSPNREYLIASAVARGRQQLWSRRYSVNALSQA